MFPKILCIWEEEEKEETSLDGITDCGASQLMNSSSFFHCVAENA